MAITKPVQILIVSSFLTLCFAIPSYHTPTSLAFPREYSAVAKETDANHGIGQAQIQASSQPTLIQSQVSTGFELAPSESVDTQYFTYLPYILHHELPTHIAEEDYDPNPDNSYQIGYAVPNYLDAPAIQMPDLMWQYAGQVWGDCETRTASLIPYFDFTYHEGLGGWGHAQINDGWIYNPGGVLSFEKAHLDFWNDYDRILFAVILFEYQESINRQGWAQWLNCAIAKGAIK